MLRKSYYLPIPDEDELKFQSNSRLLGIDMRDEAQLLFTREIILKYKSEFDAFPADAALNHRGFYLVNGSFMAGDGNAYYALIRNLKPKTIVEIGAGNSTLLANHAIQQNMREDGRYQCRFIAIEPYPPDSLAGLETLTELREAKLQEVGPEFFSQLESGDILFIDSTHVLRSGGDVWLEYCEIIPRLRPGVHIHIHDISLPKPYPLIYYESGWFWNEQFVLQALLTNNSRLQVLWAGTYLFDKYPEQMKAAFSPEYELMRKKYPLAEPSSFWMKVR